MTELTILLGEHRGFMGLGRGTFQYDKVARRAGVRPLAFKRVPARHTIRVPNAMVPGLVQESEDWKNANREHRQHGGYPHRFEVVDIKELGPDPLPENPVTAAELQAANISALKDVADVLKGVVESQRAILQEIKKKS